MSIAPSPRSLNTLNQQQYQIMVPIGPPPPLPLNLPCGQLIEGNREDYIKIGVPLLNALIKGDWKAAKPILDKKPELVRFAITKNYDTPLHIAASAKRTEGATEFVDNLVKLMEKKDLELQNKSYNTAFILAAMAGNVETATIMVEKNKAVLEILDSQGMMPLFVAASYARDDMVNYLYDNSKKMSGDFWTNEKRGWVLQKCVEADLYRVAVKIVNDCTQLTSDKTLLRDVILVLAQKTEAFKKRIEPPDPVGKYIVRYWAEEFKEREPSNLLERLNVSMLSVFLEEDRRQRHALKFLQLIWNKIAIMPTDEIDNILQGPPVEIREEQHKKMTYPSRVLFVAAELGNVRFITELLQSYPDLIWAVDDKGLSIFHVAVKYRRASVYGLLYEISSMREQITTIEDENGNNMLHLLAESAPPKQYDQDVPAVSALQMQRELVWFQEVEKMLPPAYRQRKNKHGKTPQDLFTKTHEELVAQGERWMKETAPQCMVVAALVATIAFAAAFTIPGGYNQNTGLPMFRQKTALIVFVMADAISLTSSCFSILLLLSFFTSDYEQRAFRRSLPHMLRLGLGTLIISVTTMMIAFSVSFFLLYHKNLNWVPISITLLASMVIYIHGVLSVFDIIYLGTGDKMTGHSAIGGNMEATWTET